MPSSIVFTFIGADRPGLIEKMSRLVSDCGGNWLESRMSQLAGQFAGIVRVSVPDDKAGPLRDALSLLADDKLTVVVQSSHSDHPEPPCRNLKLSLVGNDRPGIVREVSGALAQEEINVREMSTNVTSAPMTAEPLFEAVADIQVPTALAINELQQRLEVIANALDVDISLETMD